MISIFVDRKEELEYLEDAWRKGGKFIVIWGKRRIGKTALILKFLKGKPGFYHLVSNASRNAQINELKIDLARFYKDPVLEKIEIKSWKDLFNYLGEHLLEKRRAIIAIDEFSYLIKSDKTVLSALQEFVDKYLRKSKTVLIISGSLFGLMSEGVLSYSSPLYGRRDRDIKLDQLRFQDAQKMLKTSIEEAIGIYLTVGGVPEYLRIASQYKTLDELLTKEFLNKFGYFYREPYFILSEEFKEIKMYMSILQAIAYGKTRPTEIANYVGIKSREIYPYLYSMINHGFIARVSSAFSKGKKAVYLISDPMFDTWFNFVHMNRKAIENGNYKLEKERLNRFLGKRFEIFCRDLMSGIGYEVHPWWHKDKEIDLVALPKEGPAIFGEVKWKEKVDAEKVARDLNNKVKFTSYSGEYELRIFGKSFSREIKSIDSIRVRCIDLNGIKRMLKSNYE